MQKIEQLAASTETQTKEAFEDHYRAAVSGGINEFWSQDEYTVHFRFDKEKMSVSISDTSYGSRIAPLDRSDGFQWYLSFYAAMINEVSQGRSTVFLLDNPGLELHADGQRDIKRFFEEKLPKSAQVLFVTHSPAMIDPFKLEEVRQVERTNEGTKIGYIRAKDGDEFDLFEPVRTAIGASIAASLVLNEFNVLVEGAADKPILEGALAVLAKDCQRKILVNGSIAESKDAFLVRFYHRARLPYVVCLDADDGGRRLKDELKRSEIPEDQFVDLATLIEGKSGIDFELEDLLSPPFYHQAVLSEYPLKKVDPPPDQYTGKRTKYYTDQYKTKYKIGFCKKRVAEWVKKLLLDGKADEGTLENLRVVTQDILKRLSAQAARN
jgi:predicted ATP-dependent endonuclease of OLD family